MNSLADVLIEIVRLLPVREESQFVNLIQIIEEARPALENLVTAAKDTAEVVTQDVETAVKDAENVVKGL